MRKPEVPALRDSGTEVCNSGTLALLGLGQRMAQRKEAPGSRWYHLKMVVVAKLHVLDLLWAISYFPLNRGSD